MDTQVLEVVEGVDQPNEFVDVGEMGLVQQHGRTKVWWVQFGTLDECASGPMEALLTPETLSEMHAHQIFDGVACLGIARDSGGSAWRFLDAAVTFEQFKRIWRFLDSRGYRLEMA